MDIQQLTHTVHMVIQHNMIKIYIKHSNIKKYLSVFSIKNARENNNTKEEGKYDKF